MYIFVFVLLILSLILGEVTDRIREKTEELKAQL
jgi:hypothetical protein